LKHVAKDPECGERVRQHRLVEGGGEMQLTNHGHSFYPGKPGRSSKTGMKGGTDVVKENPFLKRDRPPNEENGGKT